MKTPDFIIIDDRKSNKTRKPFRVAYLSSMQKVNGAPLYHLTATKWETHEMAEHYINAKQQLKKAQ